MQKIVKASTIKADHPKLETRSKTTMGKLLIEGLSDAAGFLSGALLGWWLADLLGFDVATDGYNASRMIGVALVILGGSLGLQQARRWRRRTVEQLLKKQKQAP